jgi:hypothetical protein
MSATIEVDDHTYRSLEFAARMSNSTAAQVVARLVEQASMSKPADLPAAKSTLTVYADYAGHRTHGAYDAETKRVDITSGPLGGRSYKTPTGAACAVVAHYKPNINANRNGWSFWILGDGSGQPLQSVRHD